MLQARSLCLRARKESDDLTSATVPAGTSLPAAWRDLRSRYAHQAATSLLFDQLNSVPSTHMRCRMTASLRATATLALRSPLRLVSLVPQAFSADHSARGSEVRRPPRTDTCGAWRLHAWIFDRTNRALQMHDAWSLIQYRRRRFSIAGSAPD